MGWCDIDRPWSAGYFTLAGIQVHDRCATAATGSVVTNTINWARFETNKQRIGSIFRSFMNLYLQFSVQFGRFPTDSRDIVSMGRTCS